MAACRHPGVEQDAERAQRHARAQDAADAVPACQHRPDVREDADREGDRDEGDARLDRRVAEDVLQVERDEEEVAEGERSDADHRRVRGGERPRAQEPEREQRRLRAPLDQEECGQQEGRHGEQARSSAESPHACSPAYTSPYTSVISPPVTVGGARDVEVAMGEEAAALGEQERRRGENGDGDGQVDVEDPRPAGVAGQQAAEQDARRAAGSRSRRPRCRARGCARGPRRRS